MRVRKQFQLGYSRGLGWFICYQVLPNTFYHYLHKDGNWKYGTYNDGGDNTGYWRYPSQLIKKFRELRPKTPLKVGKHVN
jgi:hypothetical protein